MLITPMLVTASLLLTAEPAATDLDAPKAEVVAWLSRQLDWEETLARLRGAAS